MAPPLAIDRSIGVSILVGSHPDDAADARRVASARVCRGFSAQEG
jgi:hypothetical protein